MEQETKRTIDGNGWLFRYAYWFKRKYDRPYDLNRCPFFWRLLFITLVAMPLYWLIWVPIAFSIGSFFGLRPRVFASDGVGEGDLEDSLVPYDHWWPRFSDGDNVPLPGLLVAISGIISGVIVLGILAHDVSFWGHTLLTWIGGVGITVLLAWFVFSPAWKSESYRLVHDAWTQRKKGLCPIYKVVYIKEK